MRVRARCRWLTPTGWATFLGWKWSARDMAGGSYQIDPTTGDRCIGRSCDPRCPSSWRCEENLEGLHHAKRKQRKRGWNKSSGRCFETAGSSCWWRRLKSVQLGKAGAAQSNKVRQSLGRWSMLQVRLCSKKVGEWDDIKCFELWFFFPLLL